MFVLADSALKNCKWVRQMRRAHMNTLVLCVLLKCVTVKPPPPPNGHSAFTIPLLDMEGNKRCYQGRMSYSN